MSRRVFGPLLVGSLIGFALAPLACSSSSPVEPGVPTPPRPNVTEAGIDSDGSVTPTPDASATADADVDAAPVDKECTDGVQNGNETDTDCGGPKCPACIDGKKCVAGTDCRGTFCELATRQCSTPTCSDTIKNGNETDTDCGGATCNRCGVGRGCKADGDCATGKCDIATNACACPDRMITVAKAAGGAYCLDETETTNGDYVRFVRANVPVSTQAAVCAGNTSFTPTGAGDSWPPVQPPSASYGLPVRNVDWCDAVAYCKWAGKVLCGDMNGQPGVVADANDSAKDAWFNACSGQGTLGFPYGNTYDTAKCFTSGTPQPVSEWNDSGNFVNIPFTPNTMRTCHGGAVGAFQLSGNVAEWVNTCDGTAAGSSCLVRGGGYAAGGNAARCDANRTETRLARLPDVGFRCCQY